MENDPGKASGRGQQGSKDFLSRRVSWLLFYNDNSGEASLKAILTIQSNNTRSLNLMKQVVFQTPF